MAELDEQMSDVVRRARSAFKAGRVQSYEQRVQYLLSIDRFLVEEEDALQAALYTDLRKSPCEVQLCELALCRSEIAFNLKNLRSWMQLKPVPKTVAFSLDTTGIEPQPYGVVMLLCPWNYPIYLTLMPLIGAIAAGNCAIVKPSEVAVACEQLFRTRLSSYLPEDCFPVVCGGIPETTALLRQRVDYIFYTGCTAVGRIIMRAAAEHITPLTLELGGKCPTFIDESSDITIAASRIISNKCLNAGQTCVSHDYILCTHQTQDRFISAAKQALVTFFGENMQESKSFGRIINDRHFGRLSSVLEKSQGRVAIDNGSDRSDLYLGLTVLADVKGTDSSMLDEIFGPILPIVPVANLDEAIEFINAREKPLAAYVFSKDNGVIQKFKDSTSSGAVVANDAMVNMTLPCLPFGGVGHSGLGAYHGRFSFDTFSHKRAVMLRSEMLETLNVKLRYQPFNDASTVIMRSVLFSTPGQSIFSAIKLLFVAVLAYFGLAVVSVKSPK